MARDMLPMVRDALAGRYEVGREVARGGAARVFAGRSPDGGPVAIKILHPELAVTVTADRFLREVELLRRLEHPRIARVLDSGEARFLVYYVMPWVEGPTLRQHIDRVRRASLNDTLRIARDVLDALGYAHMRGIVHRDVKPDNIVLSGDGAVLLDFGIAKAIAASGSTRLTRSGFTVGTSTYMSPEQVAGAADIDYRSDLYSLACVLYECLAGRPPFAHPREEMVLKLQRTERAMDVREHRADVPAGLAQAIARALEKDPERRWGSAGEMVVAMEERET
ncbi:MAG: serine/threonine protein kinase [Gemmatimonadota bacterium]|nr:serine/threonine protein kinase [Gemmatimonadota bacterium]